MSEKIIICFDATELDNYDMCEFRWHAIHHLQLKPKTTKSYFEKGNLIHYLLELYYKQVKLNYDSQGLADIDLEKIIELGRIKSLEFDLTLEDVSEHIFQFREYVRYYENENIIPLHVEEPFTVLLYEEDDIAIYIQGQPDLVFMYPNKNIAVLDHKRVSRDSAISPLRNQFLLYSTAIKTDTFIVNKVGFQKTKKPNERFQRQVIIYSDEIKEEWRQEVINVAREMVIAQQYESYPRRRTSCEKWDGCYFQRYCTTRPAAREFLIGSEYVIGEKWDVGKKLEEKKGD